MNPLEHDTQPTPSERVERDPKIPGLELRHRPQGSAWYLSYRTKAGQRRHPKLGDARVLSRTQAREIARDWLGQVARGEDPASKPESRSVRDLCDRYMAVVMAGKKTRQATQWLWDRFILPRLGSTPIHLLTNDRLVDWHHGLRKTPTLANRAGQTLAAALNQAVRWGWLPATPCRVTHYPETERTRVPTDDEIAECMRRAIAHPDPWFGALIQLLILTGCRLREIWKADRSQVTDAGLVLPRAKTGFRIVPLNSAARAVIAALPQQAEDSRLLPTGNIYEKWRAMRPAPDLTFHDLRRGFASAGISAGLSLESVGQLLGHRRVQTTRRYAFLVTESARAASEAVAQRLTRSSLP